MCLPTNNSYYLPVGPLQLSLDEIAFISLPVLNLLSRKQGDLFKARGYIRIIVLLFLIASLSSDFIIKPLVYSQDISDGIKSFRIGLPLFSSLVLFYQGFRPSLINILNTLLSAIGVSVILSLLAILFPLPIFYSIGVDENILVITNGRVYNSNASFGVIGLFLLFKEGKSSFIFSKWHKVVLWLSIVAIVLTFNRTYLALLFAMLILLFFKDLFRGKLLKLLGQISVIAFSVVLLYSNVAIVRHQVDRRILSILKLESSVYQNMIKDNRDVIYNGIIMRVNEGYWIFGLPYEKGVFTKTTITGPKVMSITDTSFVNVLLRYGIAALILFICLLILLYKKDRGMRFVLILFVLASVNIDSLVSQNSIFFFILFFAFSAYEKRDGLQRLSVYY